MKAGGSSVIVSLIGLVCLPDPQAIAAVTYVKEVAPILSKHCAGCHREGGIASSAPWTSYEAVRPWAKAIRQAVKLRQMPPWPADPTVGVKFRNDARLSDRDVATLVSWVDADALRGEGLDPLKVPGPVKMAGKWAHPEGRPPDLVVSMERAMQLPATGDIPYLQFLVKLPLKEDQWISACQARPGNSSVVHHMAITEVELDEGVRPEDVEGLTQVARQLGIPGATPPIRPVVRDPSNPNAFDMLAIYTPGATLETYGADSGKLLKAGKNRYINFNIHYAANGKPSSDRSEVAFWFRPTAPSHKILRVPLSAETILVGGRELRPVVRGPKSEGTRVVIPPIPPGASNFEVTGVTAFTAPVTIFQLHPHAHLRGKDFRYTAVYPDGREQVLLSVPKYDFRWQLAYELEQPLRLPAGSKLVITAHYDNSANNKFNPTPDKPVYFKDQNQSSDEMFSPFVQYAVDEGPVLSVVETVGCLIPGKGPDGWIITHGSVPVPSAQTAGSEGALPQPGDVQFRLLGVSIFSPDIRQGRTVAARGVLINGKDLNVTSLRAVAATCVN